MHDLHKGLFSGTQMEIADAQGPHVRQMLATGSLAVENTTYTFSFFATALSPV